MFIKQNQSLRLYGVCRTAYPALFRAAESHPHGPDAADAATVLQRHGEDRAAGRQGRAICQHGKKHHVVIHSVLKDAVRKNLIPYNPAERVTLPKVQRYVGSNYNAEQAALTG